MHIPLENQSASTLRKLVIHEMRKFALALELGATISDLEEIREQIKLLTDLLHKKEKQETNQPGVETFPQSGKLESTQINTTPAYTGIALKGK